MIFGGEKRKNIWYKIWNNIDKITHKKNPQNNIN